MRSIPPEVPGRGRRGHGHRSQGDGKVVGDGGFGRDDEKLSFGEDQLEVVLGYPGISRHIIHYYTVNNGLKKFAQLVVWSEL